MGGNALSSPSIRLTKENYNRISGECLAKLQKHSPRRKATVIESYRSKPDFGDCDILVESGEHYCPWAAAKALGAVEVVRNGPVTSTGLPANPALGATAGNLFQVDLIAIDALSFDFAKGYFGFNDLGNLVGRTAHRMGLSHRHDGLWFFLRDGDYKFREILLTRNYEEALEFLGYDITVYRQGFDTLEDIFKFVAASKYFNKDIFLLENRNAKSRIRDRKRTTYMAFLRYCQDSPELAQFEYPDSKDDWLPLIAQSFGHFEAALAQANKDLDRQRAVKAKFGGQWVSELTGLTGKDLGGLMQRFKQQFESPGALQDYVMATSESELSSVIQALAKGFK